MSVKTRRGLSYRIWSGKTISVIFLFSLCILILYNPPSGFSQRENNIWCFGSRAGINFNNSPPTAIPTPYLGLIRRNASVSDSLGNLLFIARGDLVIDRDFNVMPNSVGMWGGQNGIEPVFAVKKMGEDSLYYLFTVGDCVNMDTGLHYSMLDLRLNLGYGDIVTGMKNIPVPGAEDARSSLSGIRHCNNRDVWIVVSKPTNGHQYAAYLVTSAGINTTPVISQSYIPFSFSSQAAEIKISRDGTKMIYTGDSIAELCNFDCTTGIITPLFRFKAIQEMTGTNNQTFFPEFSIDSKYLYVAGMTFIPPNYDKYMFFQYDASLEDSTLFMQSEVLLGTDTAYGCFQLASDGKIYGARSQNNALNIINFPSLQGLACGFDSAGFQLTGIGYCLQGLPHYLEKYFAYIHYSGHCTGQSIGFSSSIWPPPDSIQWNFGDPASGIANYSNDLTPTHIYTLPGQYTVELFVRHIDNRTDTSWLTITIHESPSPSLGPDQTICQGDSIILNAGTCSGCTYEWTSIPPGFSSTEQTVTLNQSGTYIVAVTSTDGCTGRDTMQLTVTAPPIIINSPLFKSICSGEATDIPLTSNLPGTSFSWTAIGSSPSVTGYGPGTGDTIDQVLTNTGTGSETVTYTITPSLGDCNGDSVEYVVTVTPVDSVLVSIAASDDSICDGTSVTYAATAVHGGSDPSYQWIVNGINQGLNNAIFSYSPSDSDTVYCILTSSDTVCVTNNPANSNEIILVVSPNLPVSVFIATSVNPICEGNPATFTASTTNKGSLPNFQWFVNANPVVTNDSIFTYTPSNGDQVYCILTSSEQCTTNNPATSDTITMIVNPLLPAGISISVSNNSVCEGLPVTFTATPINGGAMPAYQWQVNGINTGTNNPGFTYTPVDGDLVTCTLTSNAECVTNNPATSNSISMSVGDAPDVNFTVCFDTITTLNAKPFKLKGGIPLGGTYSGPGVDQITGYFNPAMAGVGLKTISYSYTNLFNCSNNATRAISVINPAPFSCGDSLTDIRDNRKYPTIQIGSQCWLAVNLNYGQQIGGSSAQRDNCLVEKYCYNDLPANCTNNGALYQWDELMRYEGTEEIQGLCPPGWHVPSEADWNQLFAVYQGNAFAGSPLLYTGYSGFNILLTGVEFFNQSHQFADFASIMWSSTSRGSYKAWSHGLNEYNYSVSYYPSYRSNAFSVRCVRD